MTWLPDKLPGEDLAKKIWETVTEKGVGGLLAPWQIKRTGRAHAEVRREELRQLAQGLVEAREIASGKKRLDATGDLVDVAVDTETPKAIGPEPPQALPSYAPSEILTQVAGETLVREVERAVNLRHTILIAEQEALEKGDEPIGDEKVNDDWFSRWRTNAEEVSDTEMRRLWARILRGEVKRPGSYSLHTLDFMRRLSREDAALIEKLAPFVSYDNLVVGSAITAVLSKHGLDYGAMLELEELGIISGVGTGLTKTFHSSASNRFEQVFPFYDKALAIIADDPQAILKLTCYKVTRVGCQLISLGTFLAEPEYLVAFGEEVANRGFRVALGEVIDQTKDAVQIDNLVPLRPTAGGAVRSVGE